MAVFDPKRTIRIGVGLVIREENLVRQLLIALRPTGSHLGGLWELPGGKIETGESAIEAVIREVAEEVGLDVEPIGPAQPWR